MKNALGFLLGSILVVGCFYDVEEELYPDTECNLENISYSKIVLPILTTHCYSCHNADNNFGGITLEGYDRLKSFVETGQFVGAINHASGFSPMPKNAPKLEDCAIEKIKKWVADGAPNN